MTFLANSRLAAGVTREQFSSSSESTLSIHRRGTSVRHRVVTDYAFKVGNEPGVVLFLDVDSEAETHEIVEAFPVVAQGLLTFEVEPVSKIAKF